MAEQQQTVFSLEPAPERRSNDDLPQECIEAGMRYVSGFLSPDEQDEFIRHVYRSKEPWLAIDESEKPWRAVKENADAGLSSPSRNVGRRVKQYGWRYDYKARAVTSDMRIGPLPDWLQALAQRLYDETGLFDRVPEQVIVNEYEPGQGIAMHTDHPGFGPAVATVSLGDDWEMNFSRPDDGFQAKSRMMLASGSALILAGEARRKWRHGIAKRRKERDTRERKRRLSLTFRTVKTADETKAGR